MNIICRSSDKQHTMGHTVSVAEPRSLWSGIWLVRLGTEFNERIMEVLQWVVYCNTVCLPAKMAFPGCFLPVLFEFEGAAAASFLRHVGCPGGLRLRSIFNLCSLSRQHQQRHYQQLKINLVNNPSSVFLESGCIYPLSLFGLVP